jgi:rod shape-determining protein MreD
VRRAAACVVLAFLAVLLQLMVVDRVRLPGGSVPDVALVAVIAIGLTRGPATGMLVGFCTGLDFDLAPPASHLIGESALIFCLVGYGCGRLGGWPGRSFPRLLTAAMIGAVIGETLQTAIGMIVGDPRVTLPAVRHVLPVVVLYDILLSAVVLSVAALASGRLPVRRPARLPRLAARSGGGGSAKHGGPRPGPRTSQVRLRLGASSGGNAVIGHGQRRLRARPVHLPPRSLRASTRHGRAWSTGGSR